MTEFNSEVFLSKVDALEQRIDKAKLLPDGEDK